jgi:NAD(P)-dependent dehydrogenase (short-subunit alcohol dehydrogenase family)
MNPSIPTPSTPVAGIALVAGAMGGMGAAICQSLARDGLRVVANCGPGYRFKDEWLAMQRAAGFDFLAAEADVADDRAWTALIERLERDLGPLRVVVNNAEMTRRTRLPDGGHRLVTIAPADGCYRVSTWTPATTH